MVKEFVQPVEETQDAETVTIQPKDTQIDLVLASKLEGSPKDFGKDSLKAMKVLVAEGIAAETDYGYMRGWKFHQYFN